jgi:hypothetical protein
MWHATSLARVICARERSGARMVGSPETTYLSSHENFPPTGILVSWILENLAEHLTVIRDESCDYPIWNMLLFVLFIPASQSEHLADEQKVFIDKVWVDCFSCGRSLSL